MKRQTVISQIPFFTVMYAGPIIATAIWTAMYANRISFMNLLIGMLEIWGVYAISVGTYIFLLQRPLQRWRVSRRSNKYSKPPS